MDNPRVYGKWAVNSEGTPENTKQCIAVVWPESYCGHGKQCSRKRGHGKDGLYCKQHDPERIERIETEKTKAHEEKWAKKKAMSDRANILSNMADGIPTEELKKYKLVKK